MIRKSLGIPSPTTDTSPPARCARLAAGGGRSVGQRSGSRLEAADFHPPGGSIIGVVELLDLGLDAGHHASHSGMDRNVVGGKRLPVLAPRGV